MFGRYRQKLGAPSSVEDRLGALTCSSYLPRDPRGASFEHILMPLDRSPDAERAIAVAFDLGRAYGSSFTLLTVIDPENGESDDVDAREYLGSVAGQLSESGHHPVKVEVIRGIAHEEIGRTARNGVIDAVVMSTRGRSQWHRWVASNVTSQVIYQTTPPLILVRPSDTWRSTRSKFSRLLVALDGSPVAEQVLPFVHAVASKFGSTVLLFSGREGSESDEYLVTIERYLERTAGDLRKRGIVVVPVVGDAAPAQSIVRVAESERADLIMMVSHGRGGVARQDYVKLGSVADSVLQATPCPLFLVSAVAPQLAPVVAHPSEAVIAVSG